MKFRKLRITWSVAWGLVAVLLIVFWVRSYKTQDRFSIGQFVNRGWAVESAEGQLAFRLYPINHNAHGFQWTQSATSDNPGGPAENYFGFDFYVGHDYAGLVVPHWLFVLLTPYLAACIAVGRAVLFRFETLKSCRRYVRVVFSITCGIACLLLIALWMRSYWWADGAIGSITSTKTLCVGSNSGRFSVRVDDSTQPHRYSGKWQFEHISLAEFEDKLKQFGRGPVSYRFPILGFHGDDFFFAHWFVIGPIIALGLISSRPWMGPLRWRFSLRMLLIATTMLAVVLGIAAWATRI